MTDSLTHVLERAAGPVPPPPDVSQLVDAGRSRQRRTATLVVTAAVAGFAAVGGGLATIWPSAPAGEAEILDQPQPPFQPWEGQPVDASIYLCSDERCPAIAPEELSDLWARLRAEPAVQAVYYESQEDAYERLVATLAPGAPEAVESISPTDLPASLRIKLSGPGSFSVIEQRFSTGPGVEEILDHNRVIPVTEPMPDVETVPAEIFMVEVTPDGRSLDLYRRACGPVFLVEFEEKTTEVRARFVRTTESPAGCTGSHRVSLEQPLNGRPIIDLTTGNSVENLRELPEGAP